MLVQNQTVELGERAEAATSPCILLDRRFDRPTVDQFTHRSSYLSGRVELTELY